MTSKPSTTTKPASDFAAPLALEPGWAACCSVLEQVEPLAKAFASFQLSTISFSAHRARARLDTAARLSDCRNPRDLFELNIDFWQKANADYAGFAEQATALWRDAFALGMKATLAPAAAAAEASDSRASRDTLHVPTAQRQRSGDTAKDGDARRAA